MSAKRRPLNQSRDDNDRPKGQKVRIVTDDDFEALPPNVFEATVDALSTALVKRIRDKRKEQAS